MSTNEVITPTANQSVSTPMMEAIQSVTRQGARALRNYNQPQEWKLISLRECPTPESLQLCDTPDMAANYWRANVVTNLYFKESVSYCALWLFFQTGRIPEAPALSAFDFGDHVFSRSFVKPLSQIVDTDALDQTQVAPVVN